MTALSTFQLSGNLLMCGALPQGWSTDGSPVTADNTDIGNPEVSCPEPGSGSNSSSYSSNNGGQSSNSGAAPPPSALVAALLEGAWPSTVLPEGWGVSTGGSDYCLW
jgi:hypothetical protein